LFFGCIELFSVVLSCFELFSVVFGCFQLFPTPYPHPRNYFTILIYIAEGGAFGERERQLAHNFTSLAFLFDFLIPDHQSLIPDNDYSTNDCPTI
jgi:hypothetical protein